MKKLTQCATSIVIALAVSTTVLAQESDIEGDPNDQQDEQQPQITDRYSAINDIVNFWQIKGSFANGWEPEFTEALNAATNEQLLAIQDAQNYIQVGAILQGRTVPVAIDGVVGTEALGDLSSDLTYTPVVPCRFFDTRFDDIAGKGHTSGSTPTTHAYRVHGSSAQLVHQGYNKGVNAGAGCSAPNGEPVGIAANFTAAGPEGNGNIRVWPFGGSLPNVSLVNYTAGTNIANAGIIATGYLLADDINVTMQYGTVDALGDVTGYFYPAPIKELSNTRSGGSHLGSDLISATNDNVFVDPIYGSSTFSFNGGEEVLWHVSANVYKTGSAVPGDAINATFRACYRNTANNALTCQGNEGRTDFCVQSTGNSDMKSVHTSGRVASMPAGTYEFGARVTRGGFYCGGLQNDFYVTGVKIRATKFKN